MMNNKYLECHIETYRVGLDLRIVVTLHLVVGDRRLGVVALHKTRQCQKVFTRIENANVADAYPAKQTLRKCITNLKGLQTEIGSTLYPEVAVVGMLHPSIP